MKFAKLVRDRIPAILREKGIVVYEEVMEQEEFIQKLKDKLLEEVEEVRQAQSDEEFVEELADVLEVVRALAKATGFSVEDIENKRLEKFQVKGGFDAKIFAQAE